MTAPIENTSLHKQLFRLATAAAVIFLCGATLICGFDIAGFAKAQSRAETRAGDAAQMQSWVGVPGVTGAALERAIADTPAVTDTKSAQRRTDTLAALLSVRPMSASAWLSLAGMRLVTGKPHREVLNALFMSSVTGPNEGGILWQRGLFALMQWEALPPDAQSGAIRDLAGAMTGMPLSDRDYVMAKTLLQSDGPKTRTAIAKLLGEEGASNSELARLGL